MPIYEYECESCSSRFEVRKGFGDDGDASCPQCSGDGRRIFSPVPIFFKGSGFYVTDSGSRGKNSASRPSSGTEGQSDEEESA